MATHSSVLAWRIPGTGEPGGLLSMGSHRGEELACNAGDKKDVDSVPGWGRTPGGGHGNPLAYSCLENPMDKGA